MTGAAVFPGPWTARSHGHKIRKLEGRGRGSGWDLLLSALRHFPSDCGSFEGLIIVYSPTVSPDDSKAGPVRPTGQVGLPESCQEATHFFFHRALSVRAQSHGTVTH